MKDLNLVRILDFNSESSLEALKGKFGREWEEDFRLSIMKSHAFLSSKVMTESKTIEIELPEHWPFYLQVLSPSNTRNILITEGIQINLVAGDQLAAQFTLKM